MNVLVLSHMFPNPVQPSKGVFVLEQIRELQNIGVNVHVISPQPWSPAPLRFLPRVRKYSIIPRRAVVEGVEVEYTRVLELPGGWLLSQYGWIYYLCCRRAVRRLLQSNSLDLIHAHTILPDGFAAVLLGREFGLPTVCTLHGSDIRIYPRLNRAVGAATRWALAKVDSLVAVSYDLKQIAEQMVMQANVQVARNGADPRAFRKMLTSNAREALGLDAGRKIILFVGNFVHEKGLEFLLKAFVELKRSDVSLFLVGDGPLEASLKTNAEGLGIAQLCFFAGRRPHQEIPVWLSAADCLVLPSLSEGFPTIVSEAMQCRTPVIATKAGGTPEMVVHGKTGFVVPPANISALASAIDRMLNLSPLERTLMLDEAERSAKEQLTWDANARTMLSIYRNTLGLAPAADQLSTTAP